MLARACAQTQHCLESLPIPRQRSVSSLSSSLVQSQTTLNFWTAVRLPKVSVEKCALQSTSQLGPAPGMSKQPPEINLSPSMAYREGGKHLQIEVCIPKSTCEKIVQTYTATERGQEWDAAPTCQQLVLLKMPQCISLIHTELPNMMRPAGDPNPSAAAGAEGPAGCPRDAQNTLDACVWQQ